MERQPAPKSHQPFLWKAEGNDMAVLLVHGILGSPDQFQELGHRLCDLGCTVQALLLPGHGGCAEDFAAARPEDWQRTVSEAAAALRREYRRVVLLGHSMGGLLILSEAARHGADGLILMSTPMRLTSGLRALGTALRVLRGKPENDDDRLRSYRRAFSVQADSLRQCLRWASKLREMRALMRHTRQDLREVVCPVLIVQSRRDETVSWRSAEMLKRGLFSARSTEVLMLRNSGHSYLPPEERNAVYETVARFVHNQVMQNA